MIVRVQGDRQYRLDDEAQEELSALDGHLIEAVKGGDATRAHDLLGQAIALVHGRGAVLGEADLSSSDLILPPADASLDETAALLQSEGLLS